MSANEPALGSKKRRDGQKAQINRHEQELADKLGGQRQPASGAFSGKKSDVKLEHFLLDSKETVGTSLTVDGAELTKICKHATESRQHPGLILTLKGELADITPTEWVVLPLDVFAAMVQNGQADNLC